MLQTQIGSQEQEVKGNSRLVGRQDRTLCLSYTKPFSKAFNFSLLIDLKIKIRFHVTF
jgi:hypothetical protein